MKIKFLTFTLFISFNFPVLGAGRLCNNLKNDLIALEYKMQTDSLFECGEEGASEGSCCRPSIPETCITRKEAEANYNDIIAKLNLAKGMQAMGMTVEGHHNAFVDLEEKDLSDAIKAAENFNLSFTKADLIYSMMEFKDDTSIISGFQNYLDAHIAGLPMVEKAFVNEEDVLTEYLTTKCGFGESTPFVDSDFCKQYIGILNQDSKDPNALKLTDDQRDEVTSTLFNFFKSDNNLYINNDNVRRDLFTKYRERLLIKFGDNPSFLPPEEFKKSKQMQDAKNLQSALKRLKQEKAAGKTSPKLIKEVISLSEKVKKISVNYHLGRQDPNAPTAEDDNIYKFFDENLQKVAAQVDIGALVTDQHVLKQFENMSNKVGRSKERHTTLFNKQLQKTLAAKKDDFIGDQKISDICSEYNEDCVRAICRDDINNCPNDPTILNLFNQVKEHDKERDAMNLMSKAQDCLKNNLELADKQICLEEISGMKTANISTDISKLKKDLEKAEEKLAFIEFGEPFTTYNDQKTLVLNAYKANKCFTSESLIKADLEEPNFACETVANYDIDNQLLMLGEDSEKIAITLAYQDIDKIFLETDAKGNAKSSKLQLNQYRDEIEQRCSEEKLSKVMDNTCKYYNTAYDEFEKNAKKVARRKRARARKKTKKFEDTYTETDKLDTGSFLGAFAKNYVYGGGLQTTVKAGVAVWQKNQWASYMRQRVQNYNTWYMAQLTSARSYLSNLSTLSSTSSFSSSGLYGYSF